MSGAVKAPGGGITTFVFKVSRFIGLSGIMLLTSLNKSVVKGREFTITSPSISKVHNNSSFRLVPWVFNKEVKIVLALLICLSHTPPILLADGGFSFHSIHSPPLSLMKSLIFSWSISAKAFLNLEEAPTKLLPLSDLRGLMFPLWPINLRKHKMNESVFSEATVSMWMALLDKHVNKAS